MKCLICGQAAEEKYILSTVVKVYDGGLKQWREKQFVGPYSPRMGEYVADAQCRRIYCGCNKGKGRHS